MKKALNAKILRNDESMIKLLRDEGKKEPDNKVQVYSRGIIQVDLFTMPTYNNVKYFILYVDIKDNDVFGMTLTDKTASTVAKTLERAIIYFKQFSMLQSDPGAEFKNKEFETICKNNNIEQIFSLTNRNASSVVEGLGGFIKSYLNEYMSVKSMKVGRYALDWTSKFDQILEIVRKHKKFKPFKADNYDTIKSNDPKVSDSVHVRIDQPRGLLNNAKLHGGFRTGDLKFTKEKHKVVGIENRGNGPLRFKVEGYKHTTFNRNQLKN